MEIPHSWSYHIDTLDQLIIDSGSNRMMYINMKLAQCKLSKILNSSCMPVCKDHNIDRLSIYIIRLHLLIH